MFNKNKHLTRLATKRRQHLIRKHWEEALYTLVFVTLTLIISLAIFNIPLTKV